MNENMNMKLEKGPSDASLHDSPVNGSAHSLEKEKHFQQELAAALVGKWPDGRTEIDEFNRDTFYNKAIATFRGADADIQEQFVEDMKIVKYEDMEELFDNYVTFIGNRRARDFGKVEMQDSESVDVTTGSEESKEKAA